ncbi:S-adenosyl-L-methionine-dependent methyltransferase [Cryomyces antarcticus]
MPIVGDGGYWQPNDDKQNNHEGIVSVESISDRLFLAPIQDPSKVLDVGTGTGIWAIDMADPFPDCEVIGTDLSPTQVNIAPPNVTFEIDDSQSVWTYPENSFDYIHIRGLFGSISDWPRFYKECFTHIQPGGFLEHFEFSVIARAEDGSLTPGNPFTRWSQNAKEAGDKIGKTFEIAEHTKYLIAQAGFIDVVEERFKWPIGPWSSDAKLKELGRWNLLSWEEGMEG